MARSTSRSSGTKKASPSKRSSATSSTAKSSTSKKSPAKKSPTKKSPAKKTTMGKSPARKSSVSKSDQASKHNGRAAPRAESRPPARAGQVAARAAEELLELTGKGVEGITGLERTDDGWTVHVEVVEVRRIPDTTDVLALYEIETDRHGSMQGYRRLRRYARGVPGED